MSDCDSESLTAAAPPAMKIGMNARARVGEIARATRALPKTRARRQQDAATGQARAVDRDHDEGGRAAQTHDGAHRAVASRIGVEDLVGEDRQQDQRREAEDLGHDDRQREQGEQVVAADQEQGSPDAHRRVADRVGGRQTRRTSADGAPTSRRTALRPRATAITRNAAVGP